MKKLVLGVLCAIVLTGCKVNHNQSSENETDRLDESWKAYCIAYNVDSENPTTEQENYFLDCWCGSVDEELALEINK